MTQSLDDLGQQLLDAAKSAGASAADALAVDGISHSIESDYNIKSLMCQSLL